MLRKFLKLRLPIIIDRTFTLPDRNRITVHYIPASYFKGATPNWWLSKKYLLRMFRKANYYMSPWWHTPQHPEGTIGFLAYPQEYKGGSCDIGKDIGDFKVKGTSFGI